MNINMFYNKLKTICQQNCNRHRLMYKYGCRYSSSLRIHRSSYQDVNLPNVPLHEYLWQNANKWPNNVAIECALSGKKYTYNDLQVKCKNLANSLRKFGLKKGDHISIFLPNIPEYPIVLFGSIECGLAAILINSRSTTDELLHYLKDSDSRTIICHPSNISTVKQTVNLLKKDMRIICTQDIKGEWPVQCDGFIKLDELIDVYSYGKEYNTEDVEMSSTILIAYSSGTTGLPKGVCLSHKSITANIEQFSSPPISKYMEAHGTYQEVIPGILPFFHVYGSVILLAGGFTHGSRIVTLPEYSTNNFFDILKNNNNINLYLVPPLLFMLQQRSEVTKDLLKGVREIMVGAAPCGANDFNTFTNNVEHEIRFSQAYGLTESSPLLTININKGLQKKPSSVGKLLANTACKVINPESKEILDINMHGELCFKGPQLMNGYFNNAEATSKTLDDEGWLHTGDIGYCDNQGYFYIFDRIKEMIKVNSFQVAPAEIEEVIRRHPEVLEAGVVGISSVSTGETPVAFVQTIPGAKVSEHDIKTFLASKLSKYKQPSAVKFIKIIPKTPSGKILRKNLRQLISS